MQNRAIVREAQRPALNDAATRNPTNNAAANECQPPAATAPTTPTGCPASTWLRQIASHTKPAITAAEHNSQSPTNRPDQRGRGVRNLSPRPVSRRSKAATSASATVAAPTSTCVPIARVVDARLPVEASRSRSSYPARDAGSTRTTRRIRRPLTTGAEYCALQQDASYLSRCRSRSAPPPVRSGSGSAEPANRRRVSARARQCAGRFGAWASLRRL